jgi:predicted nucleotidyltransferase
MDPNLAVLELTAHALGDELLRDIVLVGGCAVGLLAANDKDLNIRATVDVDFVLEVAAKGDYYAFCERLRQKGFREASEANVICRWRTRELTIDVMPTDESVLGFTNMWYSEAVRTASEHTLPSGIIINLVGAAEFLATKLDAFSHRGNGDLLHHDIEDIVTVLEGRDSVVDEISSSSKDIRTYLVDGFDDLLSTAEFHDKLPWLLGPNRSRERYELVVARMRQIAGI